MAEGQEFISKEQLKVLFVENFLGNFGELCLVAGDLRMCRITMLEKLFQLPVKGCPLQHLSIWI